MYAICCIFILRSRDKITRVWSQPQDLPEKQILGSRQEQAPQKVKRKKKVSRHLNWPNVCPEIQVNESIWCLNYGLPFSNFLNREIHVTDYDGLCVKIKLVAWKCDSETSRFDSFPPRTLILVSFRKNGCPPYPKVCSFQVSLNARHSLAFQVWHGPA
jgi:hypothetical protein